MASGTRLVTVLVFLVFASALTLTVVKDFYRSAFVEHEKLRHERYELQTDWGRLQLEYSWFRMNGRIEGLARTQLGMDYPRDVIAVDIR